jgi:Domain of unknown function (DUF4129)
MTNGRRAGFTRKRPDMASGRWTSAPRPITLEAVGGSERLKAIQPLAAVAGVALLALLVALASRPSAGAAPEAASTAAQITLDSVVYLLAALTLCGLPLLVWLLWPQRDAPRRPGQPRRRNPVLAAVSFGVALLALLLLRSGRLGTLPALQAGPQSAVSPPGGLPRAPAGGVGAGADWPALAIALGLLAVVAFLAWRALRTPPTGAASRPAPAELEAVLDDALAAAAAEGDPRRAVIAAWARVERLLAERGLARRPSEAPFEYAGAASAAAGLEPRALEGLAALYEWARFSQHPVTPDMRREALERLSDVREGIRLAA